MKSNPNMTDPIIPLPPKNPTKFKIVKNVAVLCIGVLGLFTSYDGLAMLQSTMNSEKGIGVMSQAILYICFCVSSLIFPKYFIKKFGSKLTFAFSMLTYVPYIAYNFYPHWGLMIPSSIVVGFGAPLLWGSQANYLNDLSVVYADLILLAEKKLQAGEHPDKTGGASLVSNVNVDYGGVDSCAKDEPKMDCERGVNIENGGVDRQSEDNHEIGVETSLPVGSTSPYLAAYNLFPQNRQTQNTTSEYCARFDKTSSTITQDVLNHPHTNSTTKAVDSLQILSSACRNSGKDIKPNQSGSFKTLSTDYIPEVQLGRKNSNVSPATNDARRKKVVESTTARFFGIHGLVYLSSHFWSNIMSYYVLRGGELDDGLAAVGNNGSCSCGAGFCNSDPDSVYCIQQNMQLPSEYTRNLLTGVCVSLSLASVLLVFLFLDPLHTEGGRKEAEEEEGVGFSLQLASATFRLARRKELLLLLPASLNLGMSQGFFAGDFNKAFVGCAWGGASHVGPVAVCYGAACALSSFAAGWAVRRAGRAAVFTFAALLYVGACIMLLWWVPDPNAPDYFFVASAMWGTCIGIAWSQLRAFYGVLFLADEEAAFATFHMWYSLGFCVSFATSSFLCTSLKIYALLAISVLGHAGYLFVERRHANNTIK